MATGEGGAITFPAGQHPNRISSNSKTSPKLVLPLALRNALPAYGNEILIMVKATSLVSVITLMDVTGIAYRIISDTYRVTPVFVIAGGIYLALNATVVVLLGALERHLYPERRNPPRPPRRVRWLRRSVS